MPKRHIQRPIAPSLWRGPGAALPRAFCPCHMDMSSDPYGLFGIEKWASIIASATLCSSISPTDFPIAPEKFCTIGHHEQYKHPSFAPPLHRDGVQPACCAVHAALSLTFPLHPLYTRATARRLLASGSPFLSGDFSRSTQQRRTRYGEPIGTRRSPRTPSPYPCGTHTHTVERRLRLWRRLACGLVVLLVLGLILSSSTAQEGRTLEGNRSLGQRLDDVEDVLRKLQKLLTHITIAKDDEGRLEIILSRVNLRTVNGLGSTNCTDMQGTPIPDCPKRAGQPDRGL
jgi:hypothetical protein